MYLREIFSFSTEPLRLIGTETTTDAYVTSVKSLSVTETLGRLRTVRINGRVASTADTIYAQLQDCIHPLRTAELELELDVNSPKLVRFLDTDGVVHLPGLQCDNLVTMSFNPVQVLGNWYFMSTALPLNMTRSSAVAERPRDALCH